MTAADEGDALLARAGVASSDLASLLELIGNTDVVELDVTVGTTRLSLRRSASVASPVQVSREGPVDEPTLAVTSPLVGVFRTAVAVGATLEAGQPIGAVEALGLPTTVEAPLPGTVEDVLVADGSPVEYGQPLVVLRRVHAA